MAQRRIVIQEEVEPQDWQSIESLGLLESMLDKDSLGVEFEFSPDPGGVPDGEVGSIYFIQEGLTGPIKIGYSKTPFLRKKKLQTGNATQLRFLGIISGTLDEEQWLHKRFARYHLRGEWFIPDETFVQQILALIQENVNPSLGN